MRVFKFGGASVKDAEGVKNVAKVLQTTGYDEVLLVISAMGKMTNAFETITDAYFQKSEVLPERINQARDFHFDIIGQLFADREHPVYSNVENLFMQINRFMFRNRSKDFDFIYDQIVSVAELIATKIVSHYLNEIGISNTWLDVRKCIVTNSDFRDAKVDWNFTENNIGNQVKPVTLYVTQGFIASNSKGQTTTLGREGSDYTAGIFAYCLNAASLTIWKDVTGVLNADPRYFNDALLLEQISYTEAIELAFFGASVIHPKTLQPLQKKEIPLYVRSFQYPEKEGTVVTRGATIVPYTPCYIVKTDQILLSVSTKDFSFIVEQNISDIFALLHRYKMRVSLMQNSAISFWMCMEDKYGKFESLLAELEHNFKMEFFKPVTLYTIRHFNQEALQKIENGKKLLLKQITRETVQLVIQ